MCVSQMIHLPFFTLDCTCVVIRHIQERDLLGGLAVVGLGVGLGLGG